MDVTTKAVVLKSTDFKESDKYVLLYSLEYGKISVHARGVRKNSDNTNWRSLRIGLRLKRANSWRAFFVCGKI